MTTNKKMWKSSGRNTHKFLMKESFRIFKKEGFKVELEKRLTSGVVDVFAKKGKNKIGIECLVRPTLKMVEAKLKYEKDLTKLIVAYPKTYQPKFPISEFVEILEIELPEYLDKKTFITDNKLSKESIERLHYLQEKYKDKIISIVTRSNTGQKRINIPRSDTTIKDGDWVSVTKFEESKK